MYCAGRLAAAAADKARSLATRNQAEVQRIAADMEAIALLAQFYRDKVTAAVDGLIFIRTGSLGDLDRCVDNLARSVDTYRRLTALCSRTYLYCAGRHDAGRRYPYPAPKYLVWADVLPEFEAELALVRNNARQIRQRPQPLSPGELSARFFTEAVR